MSERHPDFKLVVQGAQPAKPMLEQKVSYRKRVPPYWVELGYELDTDTGLFHKFYTKADGTIAHEVVLDAETFHSHRRINLARALMAKAASNGKATG